MTYRPRISFKQGALTYEGLHSSFTLSPEDTIEILRLLAPDLDPGDDENLPYLLQPQGA